MGLRERKSMGFGKFQSLVTLIVLVLQVTVVGLVDANHSNKDGFYFNMISAPHVLEWACNAVRVRTEKGRSELHTELSHSQEESVLLSSIEDDEQHDRRKRKLDSIVTSVGWGLCSRIGRGGKLGDSGTSTVPVNSNPDATDEDDSISVDIATVATSSTSDSSKSDGQETAHSAEADNSEPDRSSPSADYSNSEYSFGLVYDNDGSESDPDGIPRRYLTMQNGNREKAKKAMEATVQWREENEINTILARPHPKFDVCKKVFPHYFCGRDETDHVILLQRPGLIDLKLAKTNNLIGEDLLYHYVYAMEYLWRIVEASNPDATMTSIIDLTGLNFSVLTKTELIRVVKLFCTTMDAHFPTRSHKTLLINSPKWFHTLYKVISPLLRESTKQKISIHSKGKKQDETLRELLSECPIPESSGKKDEPVQEIPPSAMEQELRDFCIARLDESNAAMQVVIS